MKPIVWKHHALSLLDQTRLPETEHYIECTSWQQVAEAITALRVRGAPAIGVAAAYAVVLAAQQRASLAETSWDSYIAQLLADCDALEATRPTAVNLHWALSEMRKSMQEAARTQSTSALMATLEKRALAIEKEDTTLCDRIAAHGVTLFTEKSSYRILTHCNTGVLATAGRGTALGVLYLLHEQHKLEHVYVDETRPLLQGARLTAYELTHHQVPATLITDSMAAYAMQQGYIDAVIVGADRITLEGDVANKIGTYSVACLAKHHGIPFYVAAPFSTFDFQMEKGSSIPIEQRTSEEVSMIQGIRTAPETIQVWNPAFDVTPHDVIDAIITEEGVLRAPYKEAITALRQRIAERTETL